MAVVVEAKTQQTRQVSSKSSFTKLGTRSEPDVTRNVLFVVAS